jgi:hypothetical protein
MSCTTKHWCGAPVHHGPAARNGGALTGVHACGWLRPQKLITTELEWRGGGAILTVGDPHDGARMEREAAGDDRDGRRPHVLDGEVVQSMEEISWGAKRIAGKTPGQQRLL